MRYNQFIINNLDALSYNYNSRLKFIGNTSFEYFCEFIYVGLKNGAYLPDEYIKNINYKENK